MKKKQIISSSNVEKGFLAKNNQPLRASSQERIGIIIVNHFPELGKLAALRFLEWVQANPGGVISLPTGKTPEYFIKEVTRFLHHWNDRDIRIELESYGIDPGIEPDMNSLHFIQIDEFYPIDPSQQNSFFYYVNKFYIGRFGLDSKKALLIDCSEIGLPEKTSLHDIWPEDEVDLTLRYRHAVNKHEFLRKKVLEEIDQWCYAYEVKIRKLGGIGFFLGGIGPDGHVAFNVLGSDHHSTTRLAPTNYETQAAAAGDLGGIEVSRKRHAITIGLGTITYNPDCTAIIIAAGEAKAPVVRSAVHQKEHVRYPASVLHKLPGARLYITKGAARDLPDRQAIYLNEMNEISQDRRRQIIINIALDNQKQISRLDEKDISKDIFGRMLLEKTGEKGKSIAREVHDYLIAILESGCTAYKDTTFLHTAPHHDDIMLGYFPWVVRNMRDASNTHHFTYLTSGFNAVTNDYALSMLKNCLYFLARPEFASLFEEKYFEDSSAISRNRDVWQYLDGVAADSVFMKHEGEARRIYRILMEVFEEEDPENLEPRIHEMISYFKTQYAGKKDLPHIQRFKGMIREWEADCLWGYMGFDATTIHHMRLGFYKGDIFTEEPTIKRDVQPILKLLHQVNPDIVSVALDPEASGPDTHYKVMQAVSEALRLYEKDSGLKNIKVLGYRNVWYRFHPGEADMIVPVSLNMLSMMDNAFMNSFVSQKNASFPSPEFDGPFSGLARRIQVEQYQKLKTCLGRQHFNNHKSALVRSTRGVVLLRLMSLEEFYTHARELKQSTE